MKTPVKTPKIGSEDRVKLIDRPEFLMVVPLTHAASVRYGNGTKWCTSVPSNKSSFEDYTKKGYLVYCLYYNVTSEGKRDKERSKIAIEITPEPNRIDTVRLNAWSKSDKEIEFEIVDNILITEEMFAKILEYNIEYIKNMYGYTVGSEVECNEMCGMFDKIKVDIKGDNWLSTIWLNPRDIGKCVVTKMNEKSVRANVKELTLKTKLSREIKKMLLKEI